MTAPISLDEALNHYFGYRTFRPFQREIAQAVLEGRDAIALLPTGGGKSLCYQLPALLQPGLTLVISPLIALMKDQVDALTANGIAATYLNSAIDADAAAERIEALNRGEYRLLYVAPERALLPSFMRSLERWNVASIAVDEAHCVSEWGHEFRPEYRRIAQLRRIVPHAPLLALTATATERVRSDIETALDLRDPQRFVAGFNRPNLRYSVFEKRDAFKQLLDWCNARASESGIVYTQSRNSAEDLATRLSAAGIPASPYHAGLTPTQRARNQERFIRDDVRVMCATIAFGMGKKPGARDATVWRASVRSSSAAATRPNNGISSGRSRATASANRRIACCAGCWNLPQRRIAGACTCCATSARRASRSNAETAITVCSRPNASTARPPRTKFFLASIAFAAPAVFRPASSTSSTS
ncbi:MAG TPA: RecQ family ATP-dependent DNA helicase [Candidatus Baltobacteraceae bacterium]|nr:RecQ family ATP-dependent DNA helicase [Candidatus Baltobacteraceae bacterium]